MWKLVSLCSEAPKQGPCYVEEPALPSPFDILLLILILKDAIQLLGHKESELSTTMVLLLKNTHLSSSTHMTKIVSTMFSVHDLTGGLFIYLFRVFFFRPQTSITLAERISDGRKRLVLVWFGNNHGKVFLHISELEQIAALQCAAPPLPIQQLLGRNLLHRRIFQGHSAQQLKGP